MMVKKLALLALVMGLVIGLAVPVLAFRIEGAKGERMYIGALIQTDLGYWNRDKNLTGADDQTQFITSVINSSRLRGSFEVGNVGGYWELGNGGEVTGVMGFGEGVTNYIETRKLYGWYKFGNCELRAGKDDWYLFSLSPAQLMGLNNGLHVAGFGWGAVYDSLNPQIRFIQGVSKQFTYMVTLLQPNTFVDQGRTSYASLPAAAVKFIMNFGAISLFPAGLYQQIKWDKMPSGFDDTMTTWYAVLPVKVSAGGFTGIVQAGYGQNLGGALLFEGGPNGGFQNYQRDATGKIKNTTGVNGFVDLAYTFGPVTPHVYFGYANAKNSDVYGKAPNSDDNNTRMMYGISIHYNVTPDFMIAPEFTYYDYGKNAVLPNKPDLGKEWLGGLSFTFTF